MITRLIQWITSRFRRSATEVSVMTQPQEQPRVKRQQGLHCPECDTRIIVTVADLLTVGHVTCPSCALVLSIDQERSKGALDALSAVYSAHEAASKEIASQQNLGGR